MNYNITMDNGNITVNKKVIAEIAAIKVSECSDVAGMGAKSIKNGMIGLLKPESAAKGVDVKIDSDKGVDIMLHIIINYGSNVFKVSNEVIEAVKNELANTLGTDNVSVNVSVEGVVRTEFKERNEVSVEMTKKDSVAKVLGIEAGSIGFIRKENNLYNALFEDDIIYSDEDINIVAEKFIDYMTEKMENVAIIAMYYTEGLDDKAYELSDLIAEKYSDIDVEVHCVEGSDYDYIIGVE